HRPAAREIPTHVRGSVALGVALRVLGGRPALADLGGTPHARELAHHAEDVAVDPGRQLRFGEVAESDEVILNLVLVPRVPAGSGPLQARLDVADRRGLEELA